MGVPQCERGPAGNGAAEHEETEQDEGPALEESKSRAGERDGGDADGDGKADVEARRQRHR